MLIVGYESGDQGVLNRAKKGITIEMMKRFTVNAKKVGIKIFGCFMIGLPGETKSTVRKTLEFAKRLNPDMAFFQQAVPFPGTEFYDFVKENGYLTAESWDEWLDENGRLEFIVSYPWLSAEEMKEMREKMMVEFYTSPKWIAQAILHNLHPYEIKRMLSAAKSYLDFLFLGR